MSSQLPALRVTEFIRKLRKAGFVFDRQAKGSHEIWRNQDTQRRVIVPNHPGDIPKEKKKKMIQQAGLTVEEFNDL